MTAQHRVRVQSVEGTKLRCHVDHVAAEHWPWCLVSSRTIAFQFLCESLQYEAIGRDLYWEETYASTHPTPPTPPLWQALERPSGLDESWNRANVGKFVACVGMVDHQNCDEMWVNTADPRWDENPDLWETKPRPSATCLITVTDPRWIEHITPGVEWDSTAYNHDARVPFTPTWRTSDVWALATRINVSHDFSGMPILADALQEAGCDSDELLNHLREHPSTHVRGCWALSLILGNV